jgi:anaerobic dimethyl sulfoxide reductase subunit B (iron-sulfur subunit)
VEEGEFPDLDVSFLPVTCYHCEDPACLKECPVDAISKKDSDGIVIVDGDACLGREQCGTCLEACPYGVPQFGNEPDAKMQKCNLCSDRWEEGKKPICVEACPMKALDAGPLGELEAKYGRGREAKGFPGYHECRPSVTFKSKD